MSASQADPVLHSQIVNSSRPSESGWSVTAEGQTLLRSFQNAPYPHASREKGYTYDGKFFDAPTHYSDSTVGIFIPAGYRPGKTVDYVVHFHGWSNHVASVLDHYALRQQMVESQRNAILLVPQGPKDATDSGGGKLEMEAGAFAALLNEVTAYLVQAGKIHTDHIGKIVLSTHSGGYRVTSAILRQGGLTEHITDVLLFDSSYGGLDNFVEWASHGSNRRLISLFTAHLAPENFTLLTLLQKQNVRLQAILEPDLNTDVLLPRHVLLLHTPDIAHDEVMQKKNFFALFLKTSALPDNKTTDFFKIGPAVRD